MNFTMADGLIVSVLGLCVVFVVLLSLILLVTIIGKVMQSMQTKNKNEKKFFAQNSEKKDEDTTDEILAVMHSVLSEESGIAAEEMVITSIKEIS